MRNIIFVFTAIVISASALAAPAKNKSAAPKQSAGLKKSLTQEAVFNGATVNGKYQVAGGAVTAVENEKTLNDIIGGRKDFKDRLKQDLANQKRNKSQSKNVTE